jgi:CheY-like chemotaxis protein
LKQFTKIVTVDGVDMAEKIEKVLVIDDVEGNRKLMEKYLTKLGYSVETSENGEDGLNKLSGAGFDMVLLDIAMPEMDGITVLEQIRQNNNLDKVLVMMTTAEDDMNTALQCLRMGAQGYLTKPINLDQIKQQIQNCQQSAA